MTKATKDGAGNRLTRLKSLQADDLETWVKAFLKDAQVRNLSPATVQFYRERLTGWVNFCKGKGADDVTQISPTLVRGRLVTLEAAGRNPGGRHADYRALRAFLNWWQHETEPDAWQNPLQKVTPPKVTLEPIEAVSLATVAAMLAVCKNDFTGIRDRAVLLCLLDTSARAAEFMALTLADIDLVTGVVSIRQGKGRKPRTVYLGRKSRKALRAYLKRRSDDR
jgi:integrase/recombinase XerD